MKNLLLFALCLTYSASVLSLWCYSCDSTDLEYDMYADCDTHYRYAGDKENCQLEYSQYDDPPQNFVCYRIVFFHKDDGYVIMRGCDMEDICEDLNNKTQKLGNRPKVIPLECDVCNEDLCDPRNNKDKERDSYWCNEQCHQLAPYYETCEEEDFPISTEYEPPNDIDYDSFECDSDELD